MLSCSLMFASVMCFSILIQDENCPKTREVMYFFSISLAVMEKHVVFILLSLPELIADYNLS
jgi:NADH:ubiquinone oxidoreductase subunit K